MSQCYIVFLKPECYIGQFLLQRYSTFHLFKGTVKRYSDNQNDHQPDRHSFFSNGNGRVAKQYERQRSRQDDTYEVGQEKQKSRREHMPLSPAKPDARNSNRRYQCNGNRHTCKGTGNLFITLGICGCCPRCYGDKKVKNGGREPPGHFRCQFGYRHHPRNHRCCEKYREYPYGNRTCRSQFQVTVLTQHPHTEAYNRLH